jgi:hypothetical protein
MTTTSVSKTTAAAILAFALVIGFAGAADARRRAGYQDMSPEQREAMQETYAEFEQKTEPLRRQLYAKQSELDALYYRDAPPDDPKVKSLMKDIEDLDGKLYAAGADLRKRLNDRGIPAYGGAGGGYGCPGMTGMTGHGRGHGCGGGMPGHGMMRRGGCGW